MFDDPFLSVNRASLIVEKGPSAGEEYVLTRKNVVVGRGPGVDVALADIAMSREHVAFELQEGGFRARDLASTNGTWVNGERIRRPELLGDEDVVTIGDYALSAEVASPDDE